MNVTYALPRHPEVASPGVEEAFLLSGHLLHWPNFLGGEQRVDAHRGAMDVRGKTLISPGNLRYSTVGLWFLSEAFDVTFVQALATPAKLLYTFGKDVLGLPLPGPPPGSSEEDVHDLRSEDERRLSTKTSKELFSRLTKSNSLFLPFNEVIEVSQQTEERERGLRGFLKAKDTSSKYLTYLVTTQEDSNRTTYTYTFKEEHHDIEGDHAFFLIWLRVHADLRALANLIRHESVDVPAVLKSVVERYRDTHGPNFGEKHWQGVRPRADRNGGETLSGGRIIHSEAGLQPTRTAFSATSSPQRSHAAHTTSRASKEATSGGRNTIAVPLGCPRLTREY